MHNNTVFIVDYSKDTVEPTNLATLLYLASVNTD